MATYRHREDFIITRQLAPTFEGAASLPGTPDHLRGKVGVWALRHRGYSFRQTFATRRDALRAGDFQQRLARLLGWKPGQLGDPKGYLLDAASANRAKFSTAAASVREEMNS